MGTPLTEDFQLQQRDGLLLPFGVKAGAKVYGGATVEMDADGFLHPAGTTADRKIKGVAGERADATAAANDGDVQCPVIRGPVLRDNSDVGGETLTPADIGHFCYVRNDHEVSRTDGGGTYKIAGLVVAVDDDGVLVDFDRIVVPVGDSLLGANNLDDVADPAVARANLGANKVALALLAASTVSADAKVYRIVSPVSGTIKKIWSVLLAALAVGDVTLTGKIGATPITNGEVTITEAASAAGDVDSATPTAANVVIAGQVISFTVGGTNTADVGAQLSILIET